MPIQQFQGKIFMAISDSNKIFQARWVSLGRDLYEILPSCVH
jgi:hypothetical protein